MSLKRASDACFLLALVLLVVGLATGISALEIVAAVLVVASVLLTVAKRRADKAARTGS